MFDKYLENKKYVIWDWNGTLLDDRDHTWSTGNALLRNEGREEVSFQFYLDNFCFPVSEYYRLLGFDIDNKEYFKEICHFFVGKYMEKISECSVKPEMKVVLEKAKSMGLKQSILSAADQESLNIMVQQQGISGYFENIFGLANKEATCKISRGAQLIEMLLPNFKKEEILIVGDTLHDLEVGKENGIEVVLVSHGHNSKERLMVKHDKVVEV